MIMLTSNQPTKLPITVAILLSTPVSVDSPPASFPPVPTYLHPERSEGPNLTRCSVFLRELCGPQRPLRQIL